MVSSKSIGLLIVTRNEESNIERCLKPVIASKIIDKILVIDSESEDSTPEIIKKYNLPLFIIKKEEFNHGATRELGRKKLDTDIVIMLTADAFAKSEETFYHLVAPICKGDVAVTYGRQLPRKNADIFESFPRQYNYGSETLIRSMDDVDRFGVFTFFCSNSCAAYDNKILSSIGGFKTVLTNEDYIAAYDLLKNGYKIMYTSTSEVYHSHKYNLREEFKRYFDTGYIRAIFPQIQARAGGAERRGVDLSIKFIKKVINENFMLLPYAIINTLVKWIGFKFGFYYKFFPLFLIKRMSLYSFYWNSKYYKS
tara:strand:- start:2766 stop:3695 length:930 start_codon:yes stop_codon:yes gene_type:complete